MSITIFAARRNLRDMLQSALPGVTVEYGEPALRDDLEQITFTGFGPVDADTPMLGASEQKYTMEITVSVRSADDTAEEIDLRMEFLVNTIQQVVVDNKRLNGAVNDALVTTIDTGGAQSDSQGGVLTVALIYVECFALR